MQSSCMKAAETELAKYRPLSASQVSRIYGIDKATIITACQVYVRSRGRRGLRCIRTARKWRIRPEAVNQWLIDLEEATANAEHI